MRKHRFLESKAKSRSAFTHLGSVFDFAAACVSNKGGNRKSFVTVEAKGT